MIFSSNWLQQSLKLPHVFPRIQNDLHGLYLCQILTYNIIFYFIIFPFDIPIKTK